MLRKLREPWEKGWYGWSGGFDMSKKRHEQRIRRAVEKRNDIEGGQEKTGQENKEVKEIS